MGRRLILLVSVILLSAAMSNGIRTAGTVGAGALGPAVATTRTAVQVTTPSPVAAGAAATTVVSSEQQQQPPVDEPYKDSKRKVPNGPDPIHNRRARWGEAPATRV